jgi:hypothetical protein
MTCRLMMVQDRHEVAEAVAVAVAEAEGWVVPMRPVPVGSVSVPSVAGKRRI